MKILFIINRVTNTSIPLQIAQYLLGQCEVLILTYYDSHERALEIVSNVSPGCLFVACNAKKQPFSGAKKLRKVIRNGGFDIIHTHHTLSGALARYIARKVPHAKLVHTIHANHHSFSFFQNLVIGVTMQYCHAIVGNSNTSLDGMLPWQKRWTAHVRKQVIYNGVEVDTIFSTKSYDRETLVKRFYIQPGDIVFCMVGRLVKVKNHTCVLKAFSLFLSSRDDKHLYKLLLVGDGPERKNIQKEATRLGIVDHVLLTGTLPRTEVYQLLKRIDLFIIASHFEGFCNALIEALVAGTPAVVSKIPVFDEIIGPLCIPSFDPDKPNELAEVIAGHLRNKQEVVKGYVSMHYSLDACAQSYRELYLELCERGSYD